MESIAGIEPTSYVSEYIRFNLISYLDKYPHERINRKKRDNLGYIIYELYIIGKNIYWIIFLGGLLVFPVGLEPTITRL